MVLDEQVRGETIVKDFGEAPHVGRTTPTTTPTTQARPSDQRYREGKVRELAESHRAQRRIPASPHRREENVHPTTMLFTQHQVEGRAGNNIAISRTLSTVYKDPTAMSNIPKTDSSAKCGDLALSSHNRMGTESRNSDPWETGLDHYFGHHSCRPTISETFS
jgi:hypothetical protein